MESVVYRGVGLRMLAVFGASVCGLPSPIQAQTPEPTHGVTEVWQIGSIDGPQETLWSNIGSALILDDALVVTDSRLREVRRYSLDGTFLGILGGPGQGPGEFSLPAEPMLDGDSIRIMDLLNGRVVYFATAGQHLGTFRVDVPVRGLQRVWTGRDGWSVGWTGLVGDYPPEDAVPDHLIVAWRSSDRRIDTIARVRGLPNRKYYDERGYASLGGGAPIAGPGGGAWMFGDTLLTVVDGMVPEVQFYALGPDGYRLERTMTLPGRPGAISDADEALFSDRYLERFPTSEADALVLPDSFPAWSTVREDVASLWLEQGGARLDPAAGEHWSQWSLTDGIVRAVELPPGVRAISFRYPYVVGVRTDPELQVESLGFLRMERLRD